MSGFDIFFASIGGLILIGGVVIVAAAMDAACRWSGKKIKLLTGVQITEGQVIAALIILVIWTVCSLAARGLYVYFFAP